MAGGGTAIDLDVVTQLLTRTRTDSGLERLTARERDVLALMAEGLGNAAIAERLFVTEGAVHKHIRSIFAKLDLAPTDRADRRVTAVLPQELGFGSGMTCRRRLRDRRQAGVWQKLHELLLGEPHATGKRDWSRAVIDSSHTGLFIAVGPAQPHSRDLSTSTSQPGANGSKPCSTSQRTFSRLRTDPHARITSRSTSVP